MAITYRCDNCYKEPVTAEITCCERCGQEYCEICLKTDTVKCAHCAAHYCRTCLVRLEKGDCDNCGDSVLGEE